MRAALLCILLIASPAFAEEPAHPKQWQFEESQMVPLGPIPRDRCIRALYNDALRAKTGVKHGEWWPAPISDEVVRWLEWHRKRGNLTLSFCDRGGEA